MKRLASLISCLLPLFLLLAGSASAAPSAGNAAPPSAKGKPLFRALVFSKTAGFRHDSIPDGIAAVKRLGAEHNFQVDATEDAKIFSRTGLLPYRVIIFLNTTGDILDPQQQTAFQQFIWRGGGFVGIHSATDTEHDWPWYLSLAGAEFAHHPAIQQATIKVEDHSHPSTEFLPDTWVRTDEWYDFKLNPRSQVHVLASLDESTYKGGQMGDHPWCWYHTFQGGRAWYTEGGHTKESFSEPLFLRHLWGGIMWAANVPGAR